MLYIQIYNISISLSPLSLSTYMQWRAVSWGRRMLNPLYFLRTVSDLCKILSENFPNYLSVGQLRFIQGAVVVIFSYLAYQYCDSITGY